MTEADKFKEEIKNCIDVHCKVWQGGNNMKYIYLELPELNLKRITFNDGSVWSKE